MKIIVDNKNIECFENIKDYNNWFLDNKNISVKYKGKLYDIPQPLRDEFSKNIIVEIKKKNYNDVQYVIFL